MLRYEDEARALFDLETVTGRDGVKAVDIILAGMKAPIRQIANNAGEYGEIILRDCMNKEWGYGFNAWTLEWGDLFEQGVIDPATVTTWALENSASISGSLLTTEALVCDRVAPVDESEGYTPEFRTDIDEDAASAMAW
jgi:chaperonin GroEL